MPTSLIGTRQRSFSNHGSIAYDDRILSWGIDRRRVSIWTLDGRQTIPFVGGERQIALLATRKGETDLVYRNGGSTCWPSVSWTSRRRRKLTACLGLIWA